MAQARQARQTRRQAAASRPGPAVSAQGSIGTPAKAPRSGSSGSNRGSGLVVSLLNWQRDRLETQAANKLKDKLKTLPPSTPLPAWLLGLMQAQQWSMILAIVLGLAAAAAYARVVQVQHTWSESFARLQTLQRQDRELVAAIAQWRDTLARQAAEPDSTLKLPTPKSALFLKPPTDSADGPRPNAARVPATADQAKPIPKGY